jgi:hypothetical protein
MKAMKFYFNPLIRITFLISLVINSSCSTVFFDTPQPTDSKNMNHIPKSIQGTWKKSGKNYVETLTIDKNSYHKMADEKLGIPRECHS